MHLVRSWLGQALRATGAAVVVPVAILVALSLTGIGGAGLGGLGGLSQIVSGPEAAGGDVDVGDRDAEISRAVAQLATARLGTDPARDGGPAGGGAPESGDGGTSPTGGDLGGGGGTGGGGGDGGIDDPGNGGGGDGGGGGGHPPSEPPPPDEPGVVENLGNGVEEVTQDTPLSPTVEQVVDEVLEACGRLNCP